MISYKPHRFWVSPAYWGILNFAFGTRTRFNEFTWALHLAILSPKCWYFGRVEDEFQGVMTYWGLGPLGCISRINH